MERLTLKHMKRLSCVLATVLAAMSAISCSGNAADVEVGPYTVSVIEKNVYHIQDYNSTFPAGPVLDEEGRFVGFNNCSDMYLLVGRKKALLIDLSNDIKWTDNAAESLRRLVADRSKGRELIVTFTHNHGDHIGMLHAYADDPTVKFALPETDFSTLIANFPEDQCGYIHGGDILELGGMDVDVIEVPGHTSGSVVFSIQGRDIMFTGDAIGSGQGVWIFHEEGFRQYAESVPQLVEWVEEPSNCVDQETLRIFGGHYWQRVGLPELQGELGMRYLRDMNRLIDQVMDGTALTEPTNLGRPGLDTYFRYGSACIVWNSEQARLLSLQ